MTLFSLAGNAAASRLPVWTHALWHAARLLVAALALAGLPAQAAYAQALELNAQLNESVVEIQKTSGLFTLSLETTVYKPDGPGPFPVAVINHGKAPGDPRFQKRYRPTPAARYFLQRGYAVVVPMRQGFSKSTGNYIGGGCNVESNGRLQAEDVKAVLDYLATQAYADTSRVVVVGQSHGGWTTLAFGTLAYPGVKGLVNFAGGLRQENCPAWQQTLARSAGAYGAQTRLPSVWFYGDNDSYFNTDTFRAMHAQYVAAGGAARLVAFGNFGADAHSLFSARAGESIWQPEVTRFLASVGLPHSPMPAYSGFAAAALSAMPPATQFAALQDEGSLPFVQDAGRVSYKNYLTKPFPRAFAIAPNGAWGWAEGGDDPLKRSLDNCNKRGQGKCRLYSVDNSVVWTSE